MTFRRYFDEHYEEDLGPIFSILSIVFVISDLLLFAMPFSVLAIIFAIVAFYRGECSILMVIGGIAGFMEFMFSLVLVLI